MHGQQLLKGVRQCVVQDHPFIMARVGAHATTAGTIANQRTFLKTLIGVYVPTLEAFDATKDAYDMEVKRTLPAQVNSPHPETPRNR